MDVNALNQTRYCIDKIAKRNLYYFYYEEKPKRGNLSVIPPKLEFTFVSGNFAVQEKIVEITNYFPKSCFIQCLPPETRYFRLKNIVQRTLLIPGSVLKIKISFTPDENRDYSDILRIRYFKDEEMQIKIFAKVATKFSFPSEVNFGNVPLGRTAYYKMPIYPHEKTEFSFAILPSNENPCVDIYPRWGYMKPGQSPVTVMIIYRPLKYISLNFQIRIIMSDLCKTPHVINFRAYTRPGFLRETLESLKSKGRGKTQRKKTVPTSKKIKSISVEKSKLKPFFKESVTKCRSFEKTLLKQCGYFPLYSLHAVNCILNSRIRKSFNEYELKGPLNLYLFKTVEQKTQRLKNFLTKVEDHYRKNEQVKFYHKPKVNYETHDAAENQITKVNMQQEQIREDYENMISHYEKDAFEQEQTKKIRQRILRVAQKYPNTIPVSSEGVEPYIHYCKILPFLQAARNIVLRNRLLGTLAKLRKITPELINQFEEPSIANHSFLLHV